MVTQDKNLKTTVNAPKAVKLSATSPWPSPPFTNGGEGEKPVVRI